MNNNGIITSPVNLKSDIATVLGTSDTNLSSLCTNDNINKWARYKPVRYDSVSALTEEQRRFASYGFDIDYSADIYIPNLFDKAQENPEWVYLRPQAGNWFRTLDFNGYNHNAVVPFSYRSFPTEINTSVDTASLQFRVLKNALSELDMVDFPYFDGQQSSFRYAIATRKVGSSDIYLFYGPTISEAGEEILIDVVFSSTGNWELLFIATRETESSPANIGSLYMPLGYNTVKVKKVVEYALTKITSTFTLEFTHDGIIKGFSPINLNVKAVNRAISTTTARLLLHVYCYNSSNNLVGDFIVDDETGNFVYSGSSEQTYSLNYLYGSFIAISAYAPGISIEEVSKVEIVAELKTVEGFGVMIFDKEYKWEITKSN